MALAAPTGLTAEAVSELEIDLTWNQAAEAIAYDIERDGVVIVEHWTSLFYQDFDVVPSHEYSYRVRSVGNGIGVSSGFINVPFVVETDEAVGPWSSLKTVTVAQVTAPAGTVGTITVLIGSSTAIQIPGPTGGSDTTMIQNIIDAAPNGATIEFQPNAVYLVPTGGIGVGRNLNQSGITLDGQNCTLYNDAVNTASFRHCFRFGSANFSAVDCTIRNFKMRSENGGGHTDWGHGILIRSGSHDLLIEDCFTRHGHGDGFYVGEPGGAPGNRGGPYNVTVNDCIFGDITTSNWDRHSGTVTNAHHVTFNRCTFDKFGSGAAGTTFDIEPLNDGDVGHSVTFDDCTFGWFSPNTQRRSVQANGSGAGVVGAYCHTVTVQNCQSVGNMMGMLMNTAGQVHPRFHDFVFTNNVSDPTFVCNTTNVGPMIRAIDCSFITVTNNQANLGTSSFTSFTNCDNTVVSGNVDTSP